MRTAVAVVLLCLTQAPPALAQTEEWLSLGVSAARTEIRAEGFRSRDEVFTGTLLGVEGRATLWRLEAQGEYRQGRLAQEHLDGRSTRVVAARASLGIRPFSWLTIAAGPRFSVVGTPGGDRTIVRWRVEARGAGPLVAGLVTGYASVAGSVAGTDFASGRTLDGGGGEAGIHVGSQGRPVWARLGFRMDRESLAPGSTETVETAYLTFGVAVPRSDPR